MADYQKNFIDEDIEIYVEIWINQLTTEIGEYSLTGLISNVCDYINENDIQANITFQNNYYKIIRTDLIEHME